MISYSFEIKTQKLNQLVFCESYSTVLASETF